MDLSLARYEVALRRERSAFESSELLTYIPLEECSADLFHLWNIRWSAHGVRMVEKVEHWIDWAGRRTIQIGMSTLGSSLRAHAAAQAGHGHLLAADARMLVKDWNERAAIQLDADELIGSSPLHSALGYIELHDDVVDSGRAYCQIAIEYEIERAWALAGPAILRRCADVLEGRGYGFMADHLVVEPDYTIFNQRQLQVLLEYDDDALTPLVTAGRRALRCYRDFVFECLELARMDLERERRA